MSQNQIDPERDAAIAHYNEGCVFASNDQLEKALEKFEKAISYNPKFVKAWFNKGIASQKLGKLEEAIRSFVKVCELDINHQEAWNRLGILYSYTNQYKHALEAFDKVLDLDPHAYKTWSNRGVVLHQLENNLNAIDSITKSIKLNPDYALAYYNLASVYVTLGEVKKVLEYLQKADEIEGSTTFSKKSQNDQDFSPIHQHPLYTKYMKNVLSDENLVEGHKAHKNSTNN